MFDGDLLNSVHERGTLLWVQASRGANASDLSDSVRHLLGNGIGVSSSLEQNLDACGIRLHHSNEQRRATLVVAGFQRHPTTNQRPKLVGLTYGKVQRSG